MKLEKLTGQNSRLVEELGEMTGDDLPEVTLSSSKKATISGTSKSAAGAVDSSDSAGGGGGDGGSSGDGGSAAVGDDTAQEDASSGGETEKDCSCAPWGFRRFYFFYFVVMLCSRYRHAFVRETQGVFHAFNPVFSTSTFIVAFRSSLQIVTCLYLG